jgi:hypothetical protein
MPKGRNPHGIGSVVVGRGINIISSISSYHFLAVLQAHSFAAKWQVILAATANFV